MTIRMHALRRTITVGSGLQTVGHVLISTIAAFTLAGCTVLGSSGPGTGAVLSGKTHIMPAQDIQVVDVDEAVAQRLLAATRKQSFAADLGEGTPVGTIIGRGDVLSISVWEAPPAALFGTLSPQVEVSTAVITTAKSSDIPQQIVDDKGYISLPFAGPVLAAGKSPRQLEKEIEQRLRGLANRPQALVGIARNTASSVAVVGEVATNGLFPLTPKSERVLDVIAEAGGVKTPVDKTMIQITRGTTTTALPMGDVIRDPLQNVRMQPNDILTALFQPFAFTSLGATGTNQEIPFEATGITLSQAVGRVGGLLDTRANIRGVFLFRLEDPSLLPPGTPKPAYLTPDGKVPVIYRFNFQDPGVFFVAQSFPMRNKDVIYVSNAPGTDFQKFLSIISSVAFSIIGITNAALN